MPKVLVIAKAYPPDVGGVQYYTEFLARAYAKAGMCPVIVSLWDGPYGWHKRHYPEGVVRVFNVGNVNQLNALLRMIKAVRVITSQEEFNFIHPTTWRPAVAALPFVKNIPMVLTVHGQEVLNYPRLIRPLMVRILARTDLLVAVSNSTMKVADAALFGAQPRGDWEVNFNGLSYIEEAAIFSKKPYDMNHPVRILSLSRLAERKNVHRCLKALALIRGQGIDNFHYVIAGTGPMEAEIRKLISDLRLDEKVTMTGYVADKDIVNFYKSCDIFLHPQTSPKGGRDLEGFGLAIADAISFGAAAIVGKAGGPKDFVADGERGLVVDGENVEEIADALQILLTNADLREALASTGRSWCLNNLSWDRHAGQIIENLQSRALISA